LFSFRFISEDYPVTGKTGLMLT